MADDVPAHYATLGVGKTATPAEIKSAYNKLVLINHPDKGGDHEKFIKIQNAYEVLRDPQSKELYDQGLERPEARKAREEAQAKKEEAYMQRKARKEAPRGKEERKAPEAQGPHRPPRTPNEHRARDEGHKYAEGPDGDTKQRRRGGHSFFARDSFYEAKFTFEAFTDFEGFSAGFKFPADKNRGFPREFRPPPSFPTSEWDAPKKPQAAEPRQGKDKSPPKPHAHAGEPCIRCGEEHAQKHRDEPHRQHGELTFETLTSRATEHCTQFDYAFQKLRAAMGSKAREHDGLYSHLAHLKDVLSKRLLTITLARRDQTVQELRRGRTEGSTKPDKEHLALISRKVDDDRSMLKKVAALMLKLYEAVKMSNESDHVGPDLKLLVSKNVDDLSWCLVQHLR
ncbi:DnaJ like subfamily A member 2 [Exophiala aquamarina CBS 119918]|uniref:DnaJ like subfamily A member 2 n=1 Tax=Exophiala aquamarina CBS 119918 TaxID=1182545 RepID=A0A072PRR5_9EURO|nr:DnaJ like subfamily A member 2 [Exophiala aquamarina CBS 119918]KEF62571.1 DnaJ like subfamily A member 2 [Exophiala aquamarina CBS 119918]